MKPHRAAPRCDAPPRRVVVGARTGARPTERQTQVTQPSPTLPGPTPPGPTLPPAGRYGPTTRARRAWVAPAVVLGILATAAFVWLASGVTRDPVQWQDVGFSITGPESIDVTFEVTKDPEDTARCRIRALSRSYAEVGVLEVDLGPASESVQRFTVTLATSELAVTGTVEGCELVTAE